MQDINTPRGSIRPPQRPGAIPSRPAPTRFMDIRSVAPAATVVEPTVVTLEEAPAEVELQRTTIVMEDIRVVAPTAQSSLATTLSENAKVQALEKALVRARKETKAEHKKRLDAKKYGLILLAGLVVLATGYVSIDTWMTNNRAQAMLTTPSSSSSAADTDSSGWSKDDEGKDESTLPADTLANYKVAPNLPRALYIDKLKIAARIMPMSINTDGSIQAPKNIHDSGWYSGSVQPGQTGEMFIDGHASGATRMGLFAYLDQLKDGDTLQVEKGDGTRLTYKVVHAEVVPLAGLDMKNLLLPYGNVTKGLTLMTCTGTWLPAQKTYDHRVVVYAEQIS